MPNNHFKTKMGYFGCKIEFWRIYKVICRDIENRLGTPPLNGKLGLLKGVKGKLYVDENVKPVFCKARPLPFTLEKPVGDEIDRLVKMDVAYFVPWSDWATPAVPILKQDGGVRLCGDFKVTLNKALKVEQSSSSVARGRTYHKGVV